MANDDQYKLVGHPKLTIKRLLLEGQSWWHFYQDNKATLRDSVKDNIHKIISCKRRCMGIATYACPTAGCEHIRVVPFTCNGRSCSSCGYKLTQQWITKQMDILPETTWQHITLTMPEVFWSLFFENRWMLNDVMKIGAEVLQSIADQRGIKVGIFMALHTFGKDLKRNVHLHLSVTCGGIHLEDNTWKKLFFAKPLVMQLWRKRMLDYLDQCRQQQGFTCLPSSIDNVNDNDHLAFQIQYYRSKYWHVHLSRPAKNHLHNVQYLGGYIKRPPIAESKLRHYDGKNVTFVYLNRKTNLYENKSMAITTFIQKFIDHIPDKHFRLIRYYGLLANSVRGKWLPLVRELLNLPTPIQRKPDPWHLMYWRAFGRDPITCIICGTTMQLTGLTFFYDAAQLRGFHDKFALRKIIHC